jgi:hypothetical protein
VNESTHLSLALPNRTLAQTLAYTYDEASLRWSTVTAFYSAHHFVHALFDRMSAELPPDSSGAGRPVISYIHPTRHGRHPGGTRGTLGLLSALQPNLDRLPMLFAELLTQSHSARYGLLSQGRLVRFTRQDAQTCLAHLDELISLVTPYLR